MADIGTVITSTTKLHIARSSRAVVCEFDFAIGATGAVGAGTNVPGDITLTRTGVGAYTLNVPSCKRVSVQSLAVEGDDPVDAADRRLVFVGLKNGPAGTVIFLVTGVAGTGTGTECVSGSKIHFTVTLDYT